MARVTSKDVAREAGVSQTTVSFVLNGREEHGISPETRRLVVETVNRMGYVPSSAGRALRRGRSDVVLCLLPDFVVSDAMEHFKINLSRNLAEAGYACVFLHRFDSPEPLSKPLQRIHPAVVISFGEVPAPDVKTLQRMGIALLSNVFTGNSDLTKLYQEDIGRLQVEHLASLGHSRIGFAAVTEPREEPFSRPRERGAAAACARLGLKAPVVLEFDGSSQAVDDAVKRWTAGPEPVTAVAAFNDLVAMSLLSVCRARSVLVPERLAVIGVDDLSIAQWAEPPLTTVALDLSAPADTLADHVLDLIDGPGRTKSFVSPGTQVLRIVKRQSS